MNIWIIILGILVLFAIGCIIKAIKDERGRREVEEANRIVIDKELRTAERLKKESEELALKEKYGERSDNLNYIGMSISVYESTQTIVINEKDFSFDEITGCTIREEKTIIPGQTTTTYTTKTKGGSMVGRALVGAVVAGPVGAAIGGATAKKETIQHTTSTPDTVKCKYYVTIGIKRNGIEDIIYDTNFKDRAENVKRVIDKIVNSNPSTDK